MQVIYQREAGMWLARANGEIVARGTTMRTARARVARVLPAHQAETRLPIPVAELLREARDAVVSARAEHLRAKRCVRVCAESLHAFMGLQDVAEILEISPQRVHQLLNVPIQPGEPL